MSNSDDPYTGAKTLLLFAIFADIGSVFLSVLGVPFLLSFSILDLMEEFPNEFGPLPLISLIVSIVLFGISYVKIESENVRYFIIAAIAFTGITMFLISNFKNKRIPFQIETFGLLYPFELNYQFGFYVLGISIFFGVITILSLPSEEDLEGPVADPMPSRTSAPQTASSPIYQAPQSQPSAGSIDDQPSKPLGSSNPQPVSNPTQDNYVFCGECGTRANQGTQFCGECGSKL